MGLNSRAWQQLRGTGIANPHQLSWVPAVDALHLAGVPFDIILEVELLSGSTPPVCYVYSLAAARCLGETAINATDNNWLSQLFAWMT